MCSSPCYLNQIIVISGKSNPIACGVTKQKNRFHSKIGRKHIGSYLTWQEAHKAWQLAKASEIEEAVSRYATEPWFRTDVAESLLMRIWKLRLDASMGIQTTSL